MTILFPNNKNTDDVSMEVVDAVWKKIKATNTRPFILMLMPLPMILGKLSITTVITLHHMIRFLTDDS